MSIFNKIDFDNLSCVELAIYKYIVNNMETVIFMRVRDIAFNANVSSTSVFRFIKKLGFNSFPEFKIYLKNNLDHNKLDVEKNVLSLEQKIDEINIEIFHPDTEYQLKKIAERIVKSDCLLFLGMGSSGSIADYISRKFANLDYFSLSINELTYPINSILKDKTSNIVVSLSVSGETREVIEAIAGIQNKNNVYTYCITAGKNSSLSRICDYSTEYYIEEERKNIYFDFSTQIPAVLILETLFGYVCQFKSNLLTKELNNN